MNSGDAQYVLLNVARESESVAFVVYEYPTGFSGGLVGIAM
ncbi:hypothetical protein TON_0292 [Thermococcus onnurineus NA1]|uniref:Uncharacterized protein n=1 Tax=Thermococcus onnurineus (strain NA1) TaxID=523850 RepID=B6YT91_THEON|nr:hypothetical protein TON_0292 [Thermococcus onnurineus NA1]